MARAKMVKLKVFLTMCVKLVQIAVSTALLEVFTNIRTECGIIAFYFRGRIRSRKARHSRYSLSPTVSPLQALQ